VLAWDEVMDADVDQDVVICAWRHSVRGRLAAESGHDVVMAPMQFLYFDWLSSDEVDEPVALAPRPAVTTWEKVYRFSVIPPGSTRSIGITCEGRKYNSGASTLPRASTGLHGLSAHGRFRRGRLGEPESLDSFRPRLARHAQRLAAMGVHFRPLDR